MGEWSKPCSNVTREQELEEKTHGFVAKGTKDYTKAQTQNSFSAQARFARASLSRTVRSAT